MKVIIAGSRNFRNMPLLERTMSELDIEIDEIVSGCAPGADTLGINWALKNNIPVKRFPADWETHGRAAGIIRNKQMGDYADYVVAFWDGISKGTKHMIDYMSSIGKHGKVVVFLEK